MERRTQLIIGATVVLLGAGVFALGLLEGESGVRLVEELHDDPTVHRDGTFTLIGLLQPERVTVYGDAGQTTDPNPDWQTATVYVEEAGEAPAEELDDGTHGDAPPRLLRVHTLRAAELDGAIHWNLTTELRRADRSGAIETTYQEWTWQGRGTLLQVESFATGQVVWAVAPSGIAKDLQQKPSQLIGNLAADIPPGALVFEVEELAQQCSSKFIPEERRAEYDADGDGVTD